MSLSYRQSFQGIVTSLERGFGYQCILMTVGRLGRNAGHVSTQIVTRVVTATRTVVTETTRINQRHLVTVLPVAGTVRPRAVLTSIPRSRVAETARVLLLVTTRWTSGVEVGLRVIIRWTSGGVEPRQGTVRWSSEVVGALQLTVGWTSRVSESVWEMLGREITKDAVHQVAMASKVMEVSREVRRTTGRGQERQTRMTVVCPVIALVRTSLGQVRVTAKTRSWK